GWRRPRPAAARRGGRRRRPAARPPPWPPRPPRRPSRARAAAAPAAAARASRAHRAHVWNRPFEACPHTPGARAAPVETRSAPPHAVTAWPPAVRSRGAEDKGRRRGARPPRAAVERRPTEPSPPPWKAPHPHRRTAAAQRGADGGTTGPGARPPLRTPRSPPHPTPANGRPRWNGGGSRPRP